MRLPPGQQRVYEALRRHQVTISNVTVRELMAELGIRSPNGVCCHLKALEKKGLIGRRKGRTGVELKDTSSNDLVADGRIPEGEQEGSETTGGFVRP